MDALISLLQGFGSALTWTNLFYCFIGVCIGMLVGVLPGIGPTAGVALLLPLTFGMEPAAAIIMLAGIFYAAMYAGTITTVLINTPGEASSVVTAIDGYALTKQGRAGTALGVAAIGSFIGGIVAILGLTFLGPTMAKVALKFGPPEFFAILMLGLTLVVGLMGRSLIKGLIAALFGLLLSLMGMDSMSGTARFTFGRNELLDGLDVVVVAMGLFGISEVLENLGTGLMKQAMPKIKGLLPRRGEWRPTLGSISRGTGVGFLVGLIPGANTVIASLLSYTLEKRIAKDPSRFGKGAIEGVAGPETANNAASGSALIPLFTLGIPSSPTVAVLLTAFIIHGMTPGPALYTNNPDVVWTVIASMFIGNVILLIFNMPMAGMWGQIARIPYPVLFPCILLISMVGVYSLNSSLWDVSIMILFGLIGYLMKKWDFPVAATVLTFVLGEQVENSLLQTLAISTNGLWILFQRPISAVLITIAAAFLLFTIIFAIKHQREKWAGAEAE